MQVYVGHFTEFSEMGMEGLAFGFEDHKASYLPGYEKLDLTYFFKIKDIFPLVVISHQNKTIYEGPLSFTYHSETQSVVPKEIDFKVFRKIISEQYLVTLSIDKLLFDEKIILSASIKENDFMFQEIEKLLLTPDNKLSPEFLSFKNQFESVKKCLLKLESHNPNKFNFKTYLTSPQDFLFGSSPIEVILRGDGSHLVEWLKSRTS